MTESETAVSRIARLVGDLHEDIARVEVKTMVGAKPASVTVRDRGDGRSEELGRTIEDGLPRLWAPQENEFRPVVRVDDSIPTVDNPHERVTFGIGTNHLWGRAGPVEPRNACAFV